MLGTLSTALAAGRMTHNEVPSESNRSSVPGSVARSLLLIASVSRTRMAGVTVKNDHGDGAFPLVREVSDHWEDVLGQEDDRQVVERS